VRSGVTTFCVAPGSRSTPLTLAAESHPTARVVVCIDERSLAFYALGYGRGSGRAAAVITSSGTAVANLLPAAVEACESNAPLLLLTADRPPELRDSGANQTIDQVKIFGSYTAWSVDLAPPGDGSPGAMRRDGDRDGGAAPARTEAGARARQLPVSRSTRAD
jgi:isochorismate synthase/2-succinyl-5-enolpyruvyl-6-hydroxy-3-cyclohexene-1-carboxylate synthase/2-succinyl-6-hydroxy-2,4-cyclohexadiene-1-carboxylate synthase/O-succinylbenzoate synthase